MINKNLLIFGLVFLLFASFVSAQNLTTNLIDYWKTDEGTGTNVYGSLNNYNGIFTNSQWSTDGKIKNTTYFTDNVARYINLGRITQLESAQKVTFNTWIKFNDLNDRGGVIFGKMGSYPADFFAGSFSDNSKLDIVPNGAGGLAQWDWTSVITNTSKYYMITIVFDGSKSSNAEKLKLYADNVEQTLTFTGTISTTTASNTANMYICSHGRALTTLGYICDAYVDEFSFWNRALNVSEINTLYNSGTGLQYPFLFAPTYPLLTIKANNSHTGEFLTNFTVTLPNGTTYRNETGTELYFYNITETLNATFSKEMYFNKTQEINFNQTATLVVEMNPTVSQITFDDFVKDVYGNSTILDFTAEFYYINGGLRWNLSTTNGSLGVVRTVHNSTFNHSGLHVNETHTITIYANGPDGISYFVQSKNYTVPDADTSYNDTFYLNLTKSRFLIVDKLKTQAANTTINSFEAIFDSLNSSDEQTYSTTNGTLLAYLNWSETYNITFKPTGYEFISINQTMTSNVNYSEFIYFYQLNTIILNFYDTDSLVLINDTVTVQFIGDTAQTNTTTTGTLQVALFSPGDYTILFDADGYRQGKYSFTLINGSSNTINLYMEYTNATQLILVTVKDKFGTPLQNAKVIKQKWVNNQWLTDEILLTDFQGRTEGYYVLSDVFYNHVIMYNGQTYFGEINGDENKKVIFAEDVNNGINFNIDILGVNQLQQYQETYDISHSLTWVNTSNSSGYFRFYWTNLNGLSSVGQLIVYKGSGKTQICSETSTTATGTLFCYVNFTSTTSNYYLAQGIVDGYALESQSITLGGAVKPNWGYTGYALALIALIISFFIFLESPSIALYFGTGVFTALGVFGLIFQGVGYGFFMLIIAITYFIASIKSESGVNA